MLRMNIIKKVISHSLLERRIHLKRIKKIILVVVVKNVHILVMYFKAKRKSNPKSKKKIPR